jgi:hypothetical protein
MKAPFLAAVALVALTFAGVAQAGPGPTSPLYLTGTTAGGYYGIAVVQGNSVINSFPEAYTPSGGESPIAVYGDVRTVFISPGGLGGQYTLAGTPTGTSYFTPWVIIDNGVYDSTTDGSHNYLVDYNNGNIFQTARDFTSPTFLFNVGHGDFGITYDRANNSLWISSWNSSTSVFDYSLGGALLSSFSTGHYANAALALDPADHTLWLVNEYSVDPNFGYLEQYSTSGVLLSTGPYVGYGQGGEFNLAPTTTPEPGTLVMFGSGILGLAGVLRRKINL